MYVFSPITWIICLIKGGKTHGRIYWLTIIFFLNFVGAAWYWIKESKIAKKNKKLNN
jgi:hypothetical protein